MSSLKAIDLLPAPSRATRSSSAHPRQSPAAQIDPSDFDITLSRLQQNQPHHGKAADARQSAAPATRHGKPQKSRKPADNTQAAEPADAAPSAQDPASEPTQDEPVASAEESHNTPAPDESPTGDTTSVSAVVVLTPPRQTPAPVAEDLASGQDISADADALAQPAARPMLQAQQAVPGQETPAEATTAPDATAQAAGEAAGVAAPPEPPAGEPVYRSSRRSNEHHESQRAAHVIDDSATASAQPGGSPVPEAVPVPDAAFVETITTVLRQESPDAQGPDVGTPVPTVYAADAKPHSIDSQAELAPAAQETPYVPETDPFDQVVLGLKGKFDARNGKAEIRIDPPNLGTVKVSVTLEHGLLTAEFHSASEVVRDLLKGNIEKLKTVLEGQGVAVDRLAVSAPADSNAGNTQNSFGSATHDGRSAGQNNQEARDGRPRSGDGFARLFAEAQDAPLDLVA